MRRWSRSSSDARRYRSTTSKANSKNVVIRARVGFRRSLYELDLLSQLYLSRMDWEEVQVAETGIPGTEIVDGDAKPFVAAFFQRGLGCRKKGAFVSHHMIGR